jgi:hypothetical protein
MAEAKIVSARITPVSRDRFGPPPEVFATLEDGREVRLFDLLPGRDQLHDVRIRRPDRGAGSPPQIPEGRGLPPLLSHHPPRNEEKDSADDGCHGPDRHPPLLRIP